MCWRDDIPMTRRCITCNQEYYGDLGHRGCPGFPKKKEEAEVGLPSIVHMQTMFCTCGNTYTHDHRTGKPICPKCNKEA